MLRDDLVRGCEEEAEALEALFYEDCQVGMRFESAAARMERERILAYAAEFDPQPQHVSEEAAQGSMFGTLIASGWHTASQSMRLQFDVLFSRFEGGAMGAGVESLMWRRPVLPGDALRVVMEVMAMRPSRSRPERGTLTLKTTTLNQAGEVVMEMTASVLVPRRITGK